jgi:hypothetical protein
MKTKNIKNSKAILCHIDIETHRKLKDLAWITKSNMSEIANVAIHNFVSQFSIGKAIEDTFDESTVSVVNALALELAKRRQGEEI